MTPIRRYAPLGIGTAGVALVVGGIALPSTDAVGLVPGIATALSGFVAFALATSLFVHDRADTFQRERPLAILAVFLGIGVATLGAGFDLPERVTIGTVGLGLAMASVGYLWNKRLIRRKDVVTRDERVEALAHRSSHRAHQVVMLAVSAGVFLSAIGGPGTIPVDRSNVLLGLLVLGLASRVGFYQYYTRRA